MTYMGSMGQASNRATYDQEVQVVDAETGDLIDLTDVTIVFEIVCPDSSTALLSATIDNGKITVTGTGVFRALFTRSEMATLCPQSYDLGCTIGDTDDEENDTSQFIAGTLSVYDGIVSP